MHAGSFRCAGLPMAWAHNVFFFWVHLCLSLSTHVHSVRVHFVMQTHSFCVVLSGIVPCSLLLFGHEFVAVGLGSLRACFSQRPYLVVHTASRPIGEVRQRLVWLVLGEMF